MDFTEAELLEIITAVSDQRTYYRQALDNIAKRDKSQREFYQYKLNLNRDLHHKLQSKLLALETAEKL